MSVLKYYKSITKIDYRAFNECFKLKSIIIPKSVEIICKDAFKDCKVLQSVTISSYKLLPMLDEKVRSFVIITSVKDYYAGKIKDIDKFKL